MNQPYRPQHERQPYQGQPPGYGHGHQGYPPPAPPAPPARKKRRWPWVVGGIVGLLVLISLVNGGGGSTPASQAPAQAGGSSEPAAPADDLEFGQKKITLSVEGSGSATVTYLKSGGQEQKEVKLPWSSEITSDFVSSLTAQKKSGGSGEISCKITEGAEVIAESSSSGPYAVVSCAG